jgi:hypothetical protein
MRAASELSKGGAGRAWSRNVIRRRWLQQCNTLFGGGVFAFFDISGILMRSLNCVWAPEHNRKWVLRFYSEGFTTAPCLWQVNSAKDKGSDWTTSPFGHSSLKRRRTKKLLQCEMEWTNNDARILNYEGIVHRSINKIVVERKSYSCKRLQYWVRLFLAYLICKKGWGLSAMLEINKNCDTNAARSEQQASQIIK